MSSILYGNFRLEVSGGAGSRVDRLVQRPPPALLPRPRQAAESVLAPAGREEQIDLVRQAMRARRPTGFFGTCGYGKTTLLRYLAASAVSEGLAQHSVYLPAGPGGLRDLLHRLVGELYTTDQPVKLTPDQCAEILSQVPALIVADDVELTRSQADYLQSVLPGSSLLVSSRHPVLSPEDSHELAGLPGEAALQLVIGELGRPLSAGEMADVRRLTGAVHGQPLHLRQATALVRAGSLSFHELAEVAERDADALDRLSVGGLAERYRRALAILALAAGVLLPSGLIEVLGDVAEISECLGLLHRRGLAEQQHDRFGLPVCKAERYRQMLLGDADHSAALRELIGWLVTQSPTAPDSLSGASAALAIAEWAAEANDWPAVIQLVRVAEPILTLAGHWEASRQALTFGLNAAVAAADHLSEALFAHQQGTLALCLDELTSAQQLLTHALRLREQHHDQAGAAVTRHNLEILAPPPPRPAKPPPRNLRKLLAIAGSATIALLALTAGVVKALPSPTPAPSPASTAHATPTPSATTHRDTGRSRHNGNGSTDGGTTNGSQGPGGVPPPPPPALKPPVLQPVSFGLVDITPGQQAVTAPETVRNPNAGPLRITGAQAAGPYTITADACLAQPIPPRGSCTMTVQFTPAALGASAQALSVDSAAGTSTTQLTGTGDAELTVTLTGYGSGSVSDGGVMNCTSGSCGEQITQALTLVLTATPSAGDLFNGWGGSCQGSGTTCQVTITADANVSADFEPPPS